MAARCPSGHELAGRWAAGRARAAAGRQVVAAVSAADPSLPAAVIAAAVDAVAPGGQALRQLADALAADPAALTAGAPPVAGRLAAELIARGSAALAIPACAVCGRAGRPLFRGDGGGVCQRCRCLAAWPSPAPAAARSARAPGATTPGKTSARCAAAAMTRGAAAICGSVRQDRAGRGPRPGRAPGHLRELLPAARRHLQHLRQAAGVPLRRDRPAGLPIVLTAGDRRLRPLRPGPPAGSPLARGAGLRPVLHRRAAPPGPVRILRPAAPAGRPARPGR